MDQISRIRFKNLLDRLLTYCDEAEGDEEKAVLLRISVVALNKLRIHADVDASLGCDVRSLNKTIKGCKTRDQLLEQWPDATALVESYMEALA